MIAWMWWTKPLLRTPTSMGEGKVILSDIKKKISETGMKQALSSVPVNLIRQWCYCPRVVYYMELTDIAFHRPAWVEQGESFHRVEEKLWQRRNLSRFNLEKGEVHRNLAMRDDELGLHGIVDMAIETDDAAYAVEFKLSAGNKRRGDQLQLAAYAMLLEKHFSKPSQVGFLVGKGKVLHAIDIDENKRNAVVEIAGNIKRMLQHGLKPDSSATAAQCCICEYVNFCNDRL